MTDTVIIPKDIDSVFCFMDNTGLSIEPTEHIYILSFCFYFLNYFFNENKRSCGLEAVTLA